MRERWPKTQIILRGDSGFGRDERMNWCEANGVDLVFSFERNDRLLAMIEAEMQQAQAEQEWTGKTARVFREFEYEMRDSASMARRVVAKAEQIAGKENPRYVVKSLGAEAWPAQVLWEKLYCERGEVENRIKEQLRLFAGRLSTETRRSN